MSIDKLMKEISGAEPTAAEVELAASRVRARLFPVADLSANGAPHPGAPQGALRSCADFVALIPAYIAGSLDPGRKLLFEVHTRECVACRKALANARGNGNVLEFRPRKATMPKYAGWAIAAAALLTTGTVSYFGLMQFPAMGGGPRATVEVVDGEIYKVAGASLSPLAPGATLGENDIVRTSRSSSAVLRLNDGSRVELNQRSQISVTRTWAGSTVHLAMGKIIVEAAKQRSGSLRVATSDCDVQVKGTVFAVDTGTQGSRVAVVEGTVWVDHGKKHDVLHRGDTTATNSEMAAAPVREAFEWSRKSDSYLALLKDFADVRKEIAAIPAAPARYGSDLLPLLPADVTAVATIPNLGGAVSQASSIFHQRLQTSEPMAAWWNSLKAKDRDGLEATVQGLATASAFIGNEIVIATRGRKGSPIILAQLTKPGLDTYLQQKLPKEVFDGHMTFENGLFAAAGDPAELALIGNNAGFAQTQLYQRLVPSYKQGASWLAGADLARMPAFGTGVAGLSDVRFLVAESRSVGGETENRASVTFAQNRKGVAAWLSAPGPMGSLDFVSPDAQFSVSMLLKNASTIVDDIVAMAGRLTGQKEPGQKPSGENSDLDREMASAFGGEVTVALDGPIFPMPSWKIAAEVYYPERLQSAVSKLVQRFNETGDKERTGKMLLTQTETEGRIFYQLKFEKLPWEADWTYVDGYWVAAANRELLSRAIQNRQTGFTLPKSAAFRAKLPRSASTDFSAVVYHHLGDTLAPIADLLFSTTLKGAPAGALNAMKTTDAPGAICFWAGSDKIDMAATGSLFGMSIESMLAMSGSGPFQLLGNATGVVRNTGGTK